MTAVNAEEKHTKHLQAIRDALVAEHEDRIAEVQQWADEAKARGDERRYRERLEEIERLKAMLAPWKTTAA